MMRIDSGMSLSENFNKKIELSRQIINPLYNRYIIISDRKSGGMRMIKWNLLYIPFLLRNFVNSIIQLIKIFPLNSALKSIF